MCLLQEENTQTTFWIMGAVSMGTRIFCQNFDARLIFQTENNFFHQVEKTNSGCFVIAHQACACGRAARHTSHVTRHNIYLIDVAFCLIGIFAFFAPPMLTSSDLMQFGNRTLRASKTVDTIVVENYAGRKVL
jgi:hypothetical protein